MKLRLVAAAVVSMAAMGMSGCSKAPEQEAMQRPVEKPAAAETTADAPDADAPGPQGAIAVQEARASRLKTRAGRAFYTRQWNLDDLPAYEPKQRVSGTLRLWGSNYLSDGAVGHGWEQGFRRYHPGVRFEYYTPTVLVAAPGLASGQADIGVSRRFTFDEILAYQRVKGHHPSRVAFATGSYNVPGWNPALGIYVHRDNPLRQLTLQQLDGIFGAERTGGYDQNFVWRPEFARGPEKNIRTWGQLGLTGEWADKPINVYGLNLKYHQQYLIEQRAFRGGSKWNERLREYAHYTRADGSNVVANVQLLEDVSNDCYAIAYSNEGYIKPEHIVHKVALAEREGAPYVELTLDTVRDHSYPLWDEVYFYFDRKLGEPVKPIVEEYIRYALSREGQQIVMEDGKWLPLTGGQVRRELKVLK
ncbi:MAG: hypothetical protein R3E69_07140 [Steroidobacteraceae bacterium]